ncbi:MAG TPA: phosphoenolpyruvate synthase [Longimicrobiales bacterium]|nr:phosphoenolpyruvate synthase [Longimicrobiales bacterium]
MPDTLPASRAPSSAEVAPPNISTGTAAPSESRPPAEVFTASVATLRRSDVATAGGKGANLGEMAAAGLPVPDGFVVTVAAFREFLAASGIEARVRELMERLNVEDTAALQSTAAAIRELVLGAPMPDLVRDAVVAAYAQLTTRAGGESPFVAVRSSATVEDSTEFSFAGMFESFLNVHGQERLLSSVRQCWASAFGARVLYYRAKQKVPGEALIAVVVQKMVNSEKAGVLFTMNPATNDASVVVIEAAFGLGEVVVAGQVTPDRYEVDKRTGRLRMSQIGHKEFRLQRAASGENERIDLEDAEADATVLDADEIATLAQLAARLESHYGVPQDAEWAIESGISYLVQTRPVTTMAASDSGADEPARVLARGLAASPGTASGVVRNLPTAADAQKLLPGEILVTAATSPDWVPIMRRAAAIVTDAGGMTSHAAIVSRELGIPCVVGTKDGTRMLRSGTLVGVDAAKGLVFEGTLPAAPDTVAPTTSSIAVPQAAVPVTATRVYVNLGDASRVEEVAALAVDGVGLLRAEFLILETLEGRHPRLLLERGEGDEFVTRMAAQLERFAAAFHPRPVVYRAMDFRSNEFRGLEAGDRFEPEEENPMIGYRGCARYIREPELFRLEMSALKQVRTRYDNLHLMLPFVRTGREFEQCAALVRECGLVPGRDFQLWVMAEVPSVIYWLETYVRLGATGVSIGSNDLTQLVLGVDRDSEILAQTFDERDGAVVAAIRAIVAEAHRVGVPCSICGQAPSVYPDYARLLVECGIDSISVTPDAVDRTRANVAAAEQRLLLEHARASYRDGHCPTADAGAA